MNNLEEIQVANNIGTSRPWQLLVLSAKTGSALEAGTANLLDYLKRNPELSLVDVAYTLQASRKEFKYRRALVCRDPDDAVTALETLDRQRVFTGSQQSADRAVVFMFPGAGAQYINMAGELYLQEAAFRHHVDTCIELLEPLLGFDLRDFLYPDPSDAERLAEHFQQAMVVLPALFVTEYALAKLWMSWGIYPKAMIGHSLGEYVAACVSGVLSLEDALSLTAFRARMLQKLAPGAMVSVPLSEEQIQPLLGEELSLAVINAPSLCVVSGPTDALDEFEKELKAKGVETRRLQASRAGHSKMVEPIIEEFSDFAAKIKPQSPVIPYVSNISGTWITKEQALDPYYWVKHLRQTVRFAEGIGTLLKDSAWALLEVGPGQMLSTLARQHPEMDKERVILSSIRHPHARQSDTNFLLKSLGRLWVAGVKVDWTGFYQDERPQRLTLPSYLFRARRQKKASEEKDEASSPQSKTGEQLSVGSSENDTQRRIAAIWQELLAAEHVGVQDNFFELGGHSLLGTRLFSRLQEEFQVELPLRCLFETPTVAGLAERVEQARAAGQTHHLPPVTRVSRENPLPLSFAQQRLWLLDQLEPGLMAYNNVRAFSLTGKLDIEALERSFNELVRRHEVLRTTFVRVKGQPIQVIADELKLPLRLDDLSEVAEEKREEAVRQLALEEGQRAYDLSKGPLFLYRLIRFGEREHVLMLAVHHIVVDGWSLGVLIEDLRALYDAFSNGRPPALPELSVQYADYAVWQRQWMQGETLEKQLAYWKEQLAGAPTVLELPTDRPRPPVQTYRGARLPLKLPQSLSEQLKSLSQREGATLFMTLLAAFKTLLYRYTNQSQIIIGSPIAGRNRTELEPLIGFFVNTLVLRTDLSGDPSFRELLARVREASLGAYAHQDVPFEKLVEEMHLERNRSHAPLFQVFFALQNVPGGTMEMGEVKISPVEVDGGTAKFDLAMYLMESEQGLMQWVEYNTDLFNEETVRRMLGHFEVLLEAVVSNPDERIGRLKILKKAEEEQMLAQWNDTRADYPQNSSIQSLFEAQVERTPDAPALVFEEQRLTYRELNERANQLAHYLREQGVGRETLVGILMNRSVEMVVGLLGILKAGGAYVPLDPAYPQERVRFMLQDAAVKLLLTQESLKANLPSLEARVVLLDADWTEIARQPTENRRAEIFGEDLSHVIYTSGSTGRPKGVGIRQRSAATLIYWAREHFDEDQLSGVLASTSICFDLSVFELFVTLSWGGKVILAENALQLPVLAAASEVTLINTVPSAITELLRIGGIPSSVTTVCLAGEPLQNALVQQVYQLEHVRKVYNLYGPTEDTTYSTWALLEKGATGAVPIGRPIANTQVYILNTQLQPVPIGVAGELYLGGGGLARGYLNRPELTAERFVPNPLSDGISTRLYKTGDLARYRPDGIIDYLGRIDHQIKLRGYRIEMGEIEATLAAHEKVREAVVMTREDGAGDKQLVAYIVTEGQQSSTLPGELRGFLREKLPEYMIPSVFVQLEELPLTPNGKVDRLALPAPDDRRPDMKEAFIAARTPIEGIIAGVWAELLGLDRVGVHDNFFELGGHSLLGIRLTSRLQEAFEVEVPLHGVFEAPTVAGLARRIEQARADGQVHHLPPITPVPREPEGEETALPLSFAQQRLWFIDQLEPGNVAYNIVRAYRLNGTLNFEALEQSFNEVVRRHEALRTRFARVEGQPAQVIAPELGVQISLIDLSGIGEKQGEAALQRLAVEEANRRFDLSKAPLIRVSLLRLNEQAHAMVLSVHHIVFDGWSISVLIDEVTALYHAFINGQPSQLPELPIQYADYAVWQRQWLKDEVLESQLSYWRQQLEGAPQVLELPTDRPRPPVQTYRGARLPLKLSQSLSDQLKSLSQREGVTLFMTLLAAFKTLLYRYTGQSQIVIGSTIAGRNRTELEPLIGFFVNTLALRTDLSGDPSFRELLARVREVSLGAYAHQDLPFEKLVEELHLERNRSHAPLFQVIFASQDLPRGAMEMGEVKISSVEIDGGTAKFDLAIYPLEGEQGLTQWMEYNTDLFNEETIRRMLGHFEVLLGEIVSNADEQISRLKMITREEERELLAKWNETRSDYPQDVCLHQLFERQVKLTPDAVAVVADDGQATYLELNERADQLAAELRKLGVGPEVLVGICMGRSLRMVVGLLGILKAGGAYVPLDPAYPNERLQFMLEDAGIKLLLTEQAIIKRLPQCQANVICIDQDLKTSDAESTDAPVSELTSRNLAYLIYTSGSTGRPKGVAIEHRSIVALLHWAKEVFPEEDRACVLASTSVCFDVSVFELFVPLSWGGKVLMAANVLALPTLAADHQVSFINTVPSAMTELVRSGSVPSSVRTVNLAGEVLSGALTQKVYQVKGVERVFNVYGPTEDTIYSTLALAKKGASEPPNIGHPVANKQTYILDQHFQRVPVGVVGELYIAGAGLARGYHQRPEQTAEKFVPNPFSEEPGARMYRTGDLARYMPDGSIEFLGRIDHQVKVRGYRIELGEIEAALSEHRAVRESIVLAREDEPGEKRLVAYVVFNPGGAPSISELRESLKKKLPEYMIPSAFVQLEQLPLMPNGKVNRHALPAPDQTRPEMDDAYVAPQTDLDQIISEVWHEVLHVEKVGLNDNFFDLGGHSLAMVKVYDRLQEVLPADERVKRLALVEMFEHPTINLLAKHLKRGQRSGEGLEQAQGRGRKQKEALHRQKQFISKDGKQKASTFKTT